LSEAIFASPKSATWMQQRLVNTKTFGFAIGPMNKAVNDLISAT